jgi:high-affinity iron transporter
MTTTVVPYFLYSTGILFREGFEALLVIIALVAATRQAGQDRRVRDIYTGAVAAIGISLVLAWAVQHIIADNTSDTLEGVFQLLAAATLFYVSSWMTSKSQAHQWKSFLDSKIQSARQSSAPSMALALTAFLAVMREGAETIVFFQALAAGATAPAEHRAVIAGIAAGAVALAITFVILRKLTYMIPIGPVFSVTSILLYALAVVFAGQGIASFQESGVVAATFVNHVPTLPILGIFPTAETLAAQGVLLALAAAAIFVPRGRRARLDTDEASATPHPHAT